MNRLMKFNALALGLSLAGAALAQTAPTRDQQKAIDAARADLESAAKRLADLHRQYGIADGPLRIEKHVLRKPVIGVLLAPDEAAGVRIAGVTPDSAASGAGLKSGDRIVAIGGKPMSGANGSARVDEARARLAVLDGKTPVQLTYERDGKSHAVALTPRVSDRLMVLPRGAMADGDVRVLAGEDGSIEVIAERIHAGDAAGLADAHAPIARDDKAPASWAMVAPDVRKEVIRLGHDCKDKDCRLPMLAEAFRWNGLNLAAVDAQLGRYFGTNAGVLVLSSGTELEGLQAGDVIRTINGKPVATPREAMEALRAPPAESKVAVEFLRDRANRTTQVAVPKALPFVLPMAPRAPGRPGLVEHRKIKFVGEDGNVRVLEGHGAPPRSGPTSKDGARVERRKYVMVDKDGKRREWEGDANEAPPAWVSALPKDGKREEKRVQVIIDDKGDATVIEGDARPPAPAMKED